MLFLAGTSSSPTALRRSRAVTRRSRSSHRISSWALRSRVRSRTASKGGRGDGLLPGRREDVLARTRAYTTAAGYAGGFTPNPTDEEVCSGQTGHAEVVLAVFDPALTSYDELLRLF
jgi:hypothetical protein